MQPLDKTLRNQLERTIKEARDIAEDAARAALEQLGVGEDVPFAYLSEQNRELRRRLRVHGRQLGDLRHARTEVQEIDRLKEEVAYEHWHRMLFARFLAENNLLMYPDPDDPVAVTLEECADLAADEGAANGWELAARFAARMLPQIFRPDSSIFQLTLPPEHQHKLERLVADLPLEVFTAADSLGWVYQFWQAKKKDEVNASEVKIGARELPAVTQLFTEPYMVSFLLDNSLGAWWAARRLSEADLQNASSEEELRRKAAIPGVPLDYLRFVQQEDEAGNKQWTPAGGTFNGWPEQLADLKALDPCCGSGHFLVAAFLMLGPMRMEQEGLSAREAVDRVLAENIHGLEIDQRCVELAAFSLALSAWKYPQAGGYRALPELNVACAGLSIASTKEQWMAILEGQSLKLDLRFYFAQLYDLFSKAPTLGSLINPHRFLGSGLLDESGMQVLLQVLRTAIKSESPASERHELGVIAAGLAKAAELLAERYTLVATNVPYLGRGKQDEILKEHIETQYPLGKADLATAFVLRCLEFCSKGGATALVTPQNWLFLTTYKRLRETLLRNRTWDMVARLGPGAFETISGHVVNVVLPLLSAATPGDDQLMSGIDVSAAGRPEEKAAMLRGEQPAELAILKQKEQLKNPDASVTTSIRDNSGHELRELASSYQGLVTGDINRFVCKLWEVTDIGRRWVYCRGAGKGNAVFDGCDDVLLWENGKGQLSVYAKETRQQLHDMHESGNLAWGKQGVLISRVGIPRAGLHLGDHFHNSLAVLVPKKPEYLSTLWSICSDRTFVEKVKEISPNLGITNQVLVKVRYKTAEVVPQSIPEPESDDPTQWLFHGRPDASTVPLQVAVARMIGYRWPAESDPKMHLSDRACDLVNRCDELLPLADKDGIVCLPPVLGEASATDRLLNLLAVAYGKVWSPSILNRLLKEVGFEGKTLESWLRDGFFAQHCELFHQRPFVWHIWDGLRDGFAALVDYRKLDRKNLETLIYTYLGDWIIRQKDDITSGVDGAQERLAAAETLTKRLELILAGEAPYDIFVRWKPIEKQPIGWEPDLNDGVRLNIRPFMSVPDIRKKGAGVLREKPKIDWKKDRGKEPRRPIREYPWFWGWDGTTDFTGGPEFTGERFNDCHYSLEFKGHAQREAADGGKTS